MSLAFLTRDHWLVWNEVTLHTKHAVKLQIKLLPILYLASLQALKDHSSLQEDRTEKQIVSLLTALLTAHEPITVLGLATYPEVMSLLKPEAQKVSWQLGIIVILMTWPVLT